MPDSYEQHKDKVIQHVHLVASKHVWALIVVLCSLIASGFAYWMNNVHTHQELNSARVERMKEKSSKDSERLSKIEAQIDFVSRTTEAIKDDVRELSHKMDSYILEHNDHRK